MATNSYVGDTRDYELVDGNWVLSTAPKNTKTYNAADFDKYGNPTKKAAAAGVVAPSTPVYQTLTPSGEVVREPLLASQTPFGVRGGGVSGGTRLPPSDPFASFYADQKNRIPRGGELESYSSDTIADLLNPPDFFPEVDRRSAESAAGRGISGSPAGFGAGLRMTDEERLKRIALGHGFLTGAFGRNPAIDPAYTFQTAQEKAQMELEKKKFELQKQALELENELKRLQIRNLSAPGVMFPRSGGGGVAPGAPLHSGWGSDGNAIPNYNGTAPIGGGLQNIGNTLGNDLPDNWDPNWDWTG